jgi:hypothetical protein
MKIVLCWQTYYIASHHIVSWIECQAAGIDCIILLNNENNVYEKTIESRSLPKGMKDSLIPFDAGTYRALDLPLLPYGGKKLGSVTYYNCDFGFYVASSRYSEDLDNTYFLKVDHDVLLYGKTWPEFIHLLALGSGMAVTMQRVPHASPTWHWHPSSFSVYGQNYSHGLWGLQGLPGGTCLQLKERRVELFKSSAHYREDGICDNLFISVDLDYPLCEAFFETELSRIGIPTLELFKQYPHLVKAYKLEVQGGLAHVDITELVKDSPHPFWLFHPWKPI